MSRVLCILLLAACGGAGGDLPSTRPFAGSNRGTFAPGLASEEAPAEPLRIVDGAYGKANSKTSEPLVVPYGVNQSGTELVMVLLERARQARAAYVGDLELFAAFRWNGALVECRSKVVYADDPSLARTAAVADEPGKYGTNVEEFRPQLVGAQVSENDLECEEAVEMVEAGLKTVVVSRMDVERRDSVDTPIEEKRMERQFRPVSIDRCAKRHVERHVERYDYQLKLGFIPPDWAYISRRYADRALTTTPPVCYTVASAPETPYRMTAVAYQRGQVRTDSTPMSLPSDSAIDDYNREHPLRPSICKRYGGPKTVPCPDPRPGGDTESGGVK